MDYGKRIRCGLAAAAITLIGSVLLSRPALEAFLPLDQTEPVEMVVLMYHSIHSNPNKAGDYVITPDALRQDLEFLRREGYETITVSQLVSYVRGTGDLPEKPVMLTFDDGYYNNYLNAFPLLQEYGAKAVISIIGRETDRYSQLDENKENYSHLTWDQIKEMEASGLVEFQNHSYDLHGLNGARQGASKKQGEGTEEYRQVLREDLGQLQQRFQEMTGHMPTAFTYPFGRVSEDSYAVVLELGFSASLDAQGKVYKVIQGNESCLYRIPRYNRPWGVTAEQIITKALG